MIDFHSHLINKSYSGYETLYDNFLLHSKKLKAIILFGSSFPINLKKRIFSNNELIDIINKNKNVYGVLSYRLNKYKIDDSFIKNNKIIGMKFYTGYYKYFYNNIIEKYLKIFLNNNKRIFIFHSGYCNINNKRFFNPIKIEKLIIKYTKGIFIIAHLGNPFFEKTIYLMKKYPNVYSDISGIFGNEKNIDKKYLFKLKIIFSIIIKNKLENKLIFGTDFPLLNLEETDNLLKKILKIEKIDSIHNNTKKIFNIAIKGE